MLIRLIGTLIVPATELTPLTGSKLTPEPDVVLAGVEEADMSTPPPARTFDPAPMLAVMVGAVVTVALLTPTSTPPTPYAFAVPCDSAVGVFAMTETSPETVTRSLVPVDAVITGESDAVAPAPWPEASPPEVSSTLIVASELSDALTVRFCTDLPAVWPIFTLLPSVAEVVPVSVAVPIAAPIAAIPNDAPMASPERLRVAWASTVTEPACGIEAESPIEAETVLESVRVAVSPPPAMAASWPP